ncbi:MAG: glucuronate isomerase [Candidatus Aminicenantales bacterium]
MFIHEDFLLETNRARSLYHSFAEPLPIIDYHCHLSPRDIAEDRRFENLTGIWLAGDHYKWRAMRAAGVDESFITGAASDWEKFVKWAETVPKTLRNPLYHWAHLELSRLFGIDRPLGPETAAGIWEEANASLAGLGFSTRGILRRMNVEALCTTDDPADDLRYHRMLPEAEDFPVRVYPAFRPDKAMAVEDPEAFSQYVMLLSLAADVEVKSFSDFLAALRKRHDYFHAMGCRLSDHGLETVPVEEYTDPEIQKAFAKAVSGKPLAPHVVLQFKSAMLYEFALMDWEAGWVQQLHLGALRNVNTRMKRTLGPDSGFDAIGDFEIARPLARFLDRLDADNKLARTILYNLNPRDTEVLAALAGCFQDGAVPGKIQYGPAWWFLDQADGMTKQIEAVSTMGLLSQFVGMTTDSRSFLSYPRHEYFRRLLCNILGGEMKRGLLPDDEDLVGGLVRDICYFNARRYFRFSETEA